MLMTLILFKNFKSRTLHDTLLPKNLTLYISLQQTTEVKVLPKNPRGQSFIVEFNNVT